MAINKFRRLLYPTVLLIVLAALIAPNPAPATADATSETRGAGAATYHLWQNPTWISVDNDNYASCNVFNNGTSNYLYLFFRQASLPNDATIAGIEVKIRRKASADSIGYNIRDDTIQLMRQGVLVGENKASDENWETSESVKTYGGNNDFWNDYNDWAGSDFTSFDSGFGVALRVKGTAVTGHVTAFVDSIEVKVYYESGSGDGSRTITADRATTEPSWQNPEGVTSQDGSGAYYCRESYGVSTGLYTADFGFNIPGNAIISGIEVKIRRRANYSSQGKTTRDDTVRLMKGGTPVGSGNEISDRWGTSWYDAIHGGTNDLWGTTWTPSEINDIGFGLMLKVASTTDNCADVDYIEITVTYITPPYDADTDGDGLSDNDEVTIHHTNPLDDDSDGDGLKDNEEVDPDINTDPWNPDSDDDGLNDYDEVTVYFTNPNNADSDGDGYIDPEELIWGSDPNDINCIPNRRPELSNDTVSTLEDIPVIIDVLANDSDPDDDPLTITSIGNPSHGTAVIDDQKIIYTPAADYFGADSFPYTVNDSTQSATATVNITIIPVNDDPNAVDDEAAIAQDSGINLLDVLQNDTYLFDAPETLRIVSVTQSANGSVTIPYGGSYLAYVPDAGYAGTDSFTYTISDGNGGFDTAVVTVNVSDNPDMPTTAVTVTHYPGTGTTGSGREWENPGNIISKNGQDSRCTIPPGVWGSSAYLYATEYGFTIAPDATISGIEVEIGRESSDLAWDRYVRDYAIKLVKEEIPLGANKAESSGWDMSYVEVNYGGSDDLWESSWTPDEINDTGFGMILQISGEGGGKFGTSAYVDYMSITVTCSVTRSGTDTDGDGICDYDEVAVSLTNPFSNDTDGDGYNDIQEILEGGDPNDPSVIVGKPVAINDFALTFEDTPVVIDVLANDSDPDSDPLTITSTGYSAHGTLAIEDEMIIYTPAADYSGVNSFTYTISDGTQSATATVNVTITPVNDDPNAVDDEAEFARDSGVNWIDVLQNDTYLPDPPETLTITEVNQGANGKVRISYGGSYIVYVPDDGYAGTDSFTYTISDGNGGLDTASVTVTVSDNPSQPTRSVSVTRTPDNGSHEGGWYIPAGVRFVDSICVSTGFGTTFGRTGYLYATDYSFNIPSEAVVRGIQTRILRKATEDTGDTRYIREEKVQLMNMGEILPYNRAAQSTNWVTSWREVNYGNSNDLWDRTWTPAEINDPGFGTALKVKGVSNSRSGVKAFVDCMSIIVTYSITRSGCDTDGDGLCDYDEVVFYNTNPHDNDSDSDGYSDGLEVLYGGDPLDPAIVPDLRPSADAQSVITDEDTAVNITLTGFNPLITSLAFIVVDGPYHGILTGTAPDLTYTPSADYFGVDSFTFKVNDGQMDSGTATVDITVNPVNDPPSAEAGGPYSVDEGDSIMLTGSGTDVDVDTLTYEWDLNGDDTFETTGQTATFSASGLSGPASFTVTLKVSDDLGASSTDTAEVVVNNVAPIVDAGTDKATDRHGAFTYAGSFIDPGADTWTATVDYGDGSVLQTLTLSEKTFALDHAYAGYGAYDVTVTVTDGDGDSGTDTVRVTRTYNQGGGGYTPPPQTIAVNIQNDDISFQIPENTTALSADGNPITEINVETVGTYPPPPDSRTVVAAFDFKPDGTTFDPAIQITVTYDPASLPEGVDESQLVIAFYNEATSAWEYVSGTVNPGTNTITFSITHFTVFAIIAKSEPIPAPAETPTYTPTPTIEPTPTTTAVPTPTITIVPTATPTATPTFASDSGSGSNSPDDWIWAIIAAAGGALPAALIGAIVVRNRKSD